MQQHIFAAIVIAGLLLAVPARATDRYWDGGTTDIAGDGDGASQPSTGSWDTTIKNWDEGSGLAHVAWNNSNNDTAIIGPGAADATITLGADIDLGGLTFQNGNYNHTIDGYALNFAPGSVLDSQNSVNTKTRTITSGITGSPSVKLASHNPSGGAENKMIFAPAPGKTQTLGVITNPYDDGTGDKHLLVLGGATTGNTAASITYQKTGINPPRSLYYGYMNKEGTGTWTINGDVEQGRLTMVAGTLIINGTFSSSYAAIQAIPSGARLGGNLTYGGSAGALTVNSGGIVAPGDGGVGTITIQSSATASGTTTFNTGSIYEWEVGAGGTDKVYVKKTTTGARALVVQDGMILKIHDAGGRPAITDRLPVFTYDAGVTRSLGAVTFDTSVLGDRWFPVNLALTDDGAGTIYLTGLAKLSSETLLIVR